MLAAAAQSALRQLAAGVPAALLARGVGPAALLGMQDSWHARTVFNYAPDVLRGPPAFVFDIDGVLIRGKQVLPSAKQALAKLYTGGGQTPRFPVAFLTNGGGVTEEHKAEQLSQWLGVAVKPSQVVLSHTPFRALLPQLAEVPVMICGRGHCLDVAHRYGFKRIITARQIARLLPTAVPFAAAETEAQRQGHAQGHPHLKYLQEGDTIGTEVDPIRAILVFHDPSDWYSELQIMMDVLVSRGVPGRLHPPPDAPHVQVYFSNPDLLWANEFSMPRFGQGAFATCLEALHKEVVGKPLHAKKVFGKPNPEPYALIEEVLLQQARELGLELPAAPSGPADGSNQARGGGRGKACGVLPFSAVYAVGDNPQADVRGANRLGHPWVSVLVRTGVFQGPHANCPNDPAHMVVDDVAAAVDAALHRYRSVRWHSMR